MKYHSGYHSCPKCTTEGEFEKNRVYFPTTSYQLRRDEKFRNLEYEEYQYGNTILMKIPNLIPNLISNVALDSMHLVYFGVMKRLIMLWMSKGPRYVRFSNLQKRNISTNLENILKILPSDFVKRSRALTYWYRWKATEYRHFLLYIEPVILKDNIDPDIYDHFIRLHSAVTVLNDPLLIQDNNNLNSAHSILRTFVTKFGDIYGPENVTFNVHNLIHLCDEVKFFKTTLDSFSSFPFESYICTVKKMLRKGETPLQQIARRIHEYSYANFNIKSFESTNSLRLEKRCGNITTVNSKIYSAQFQILKTSLYSINCTDNKNDCIMLKNGVIINVHSFAMSGSQIIATERKLEFFQALYNKPFSSEALDIKIIRDGNDSLNEWNYNDIYKKMFKIPFKNHTAVFPILHIYSNL